MVHHHEKKVLKKFQSFQISESSSCSTKKIHNADTLNLLNLHDLVSSLTLPSLHIDEHFNNQIHELFLNDQLPDLRFHSLLDNQNFFHCKLKLDEFMKIAKITFPRNSEKF